MDKETSTTPEVLAILHDISKRFPAAENPALH